MFEFVPLQYWLVFGYGCVIVAASLLAASSIHNLLAMQGKVPMVPERLQRRCKQAPWRCLVVILLVVILQLLTYIAS